MTLTPKLGLGLATVMRIPQPSAQIDLVRAAWDLGFRHFDVAPLYGMGQAERTLAAALGDKSEPHDIYTKVGLAPSMGLARLGRLQPILRSLLSKSEGLRRSVRRFGGGTAKPFELTPDAVVASFQGSLERLQKESVEGLLVHDRAANELSAEVREVLVGLAEHGAVGRLGAAGDAHQVAGILDSMNVSSVAQVPGGIASPNVERSAEKIITYGVVGRSLAPVSDLVMADQPWVERLERRLGQPLRDSSDVAALLLRLELATNAADVVLVGSTSVANLKRLSLVAEGEGRNPMAENDASETIREIRFRLGRPDRPKASPLQGAPEQ